MKRLVFLDSLDNEDATVQVVLLPGAEVDLQALRAYLPRPLRRTLASENRSIYRLRGYVTYVNVICDARETRAR